MHPIQKELYKAMSPEKKIRISSDLYYSARELKIAALRQQNPTWSDKKVVEKVREIFINVRS